MAMRFENTQMLEALLAHHIALLNRFQHEEFEAFSLIFLKLDNIEDIEIKKSVQIIFRNSDIIFEVENNYIILLPKTDWNGAQKLLSGLQDFLGEEFHDTIVTYPDDGTTPQELMQELSKLVEEKHQIKLEFQVP